ncbi:hypothetical protein D3C81_1877300 [compost metagenome]
MLVVTAKRPPPAAGALGLRIGLGDFFGDGVLHFLLGDLVRTEWPPAAEAALRGILGMAGAAGHSGQAQGES